MVHSSDKGFQDLREPLEIAQICIFYEGIKRALLMYLKGAGRRPKISVILWRRIHIHTSRVISTLWGLPRRKSACTNCSSLRLDLQITRARHRFEVKTYFHNTNRHTHSYTKTLRKLEILFTWNGNASLDLDLLFNFVYLF